MCVVGAWQRDFLDLWCVCLVRRVAPGTHTTTVSLTLCKLALRILRHKHRICVHFCDKFSERYIRTHRAFVWIFGFEPDYPSLAIPNRHEITTVSERWRYNCCIRSGVKKIGLFNCNVMAVQINITTDMDGKESELERFNNVFRLWIWLMFEWLTVIFKECLKPIIRKVTQSVISVKNVPTTVCQILVWAGFLQELFIKNIKSAYIILKNIYFLTQSGSLFMNKKSFHLSTTAHHLLTTVFSQRVL